MGKTVGSRELKTRLGSYLRRVREGATFVVTDRGRPVAELRPIAAGSDDIEAAVEEMVALGQASWPVRDSLPPFERISATGGPISETLLDERKERF